MDIGRAIRAARYPKVAGPISNEPTAFPLCIYLSESYDELPFIDHANRAQEQRYHNSDKAIYRPRRRTLSRQIIVPVDQRIYLRENVLQGVFGP
jgi:hypothetical protein